MAEVARQAISEISHVTIDDWVRTKTFTNELEESVRGHIHEQLTSWLFFRKLAADCAKANICLHGFSMLWDRYAAQCLIDFHWLEKYLVTRGGTCKPTAVEAPKIEWPQNPVEPVRPCKEALFVQKRLLEDQERLAQLAVKIGDGSFADAVQDRFLRKQARYVKDLGDLLQQVTRVSKSAGVGIYHLDHELRQHKGRISWSWMNDPDRHDLAADELITQIKEGMELQCEHGHAASRGACGHTRRSGQ